MEKQPRSLNYELSHDLHFDNFEGTAQRILETVRSVAAAEASTPTISTLDKLTTNEFLQKIGATIFNSIQLKQYKLNESPQNSSEINMDFSFPTNHVVLDSSSVSQLQQQLEHDSLMNDVWIGIVFTLILISMVFCVCSCFLYHQFCAWKRNYYNNANCPSQCTIVDIEAQRLHSDSEDPVPEYTLVSGLPSYEAALELLHKTPQSSFYIVYPSALNVFNKHTNANSQSSQTTVSTAHNTAMDTGALALSQVQSLCDATSPLLASTTTDRCENVKTNSMPNYAEVFSSSKCHITPQTKDETRKIQNDKC